MRPYVGATTVGRPMDKPTTRLGAPIEHAAQALVAPVADPFGCGGVAGCRHRVEVLDSFGRRVRVVGCLAEQIHGNVHFVGFQNGCKGPHTVDVTPRESGKLRLHGPPTPPVVASGRDSRDGNTQRHWVA